MFHVELDGETVSILSSKTMMDLYDEGFLLGILSGEGHFGGDGIQAQITLRMHVQHEKLFSWLIEKVPGSRLYGPYHHGGRHYFQWMVRGKPLKEIMLPILRRRMDSLDDYVKERIESMISRYKLSEAKDE